MVLVGDRGLLTTKRIEEDLRPREEVQWITVLRAPQIRQLAADGVLQMSLFDERGLGTIGTALIFYDAALFSDRKQLKTITVRSAGTSCRTRVSSSAGPRLAPRNV